MFADPQTTYELEIPWTDPSDCTPTFCVQVCSPKVGCSTRMACTHGKRDSARSGVWRSSLGFLATPPDAPAQLATDMTPMSSTDCGDPLAAMLAGTPGGVLYGQDIAFLTTIEPAQQGGGSGSGSSSGSTSGGTCGTEADCAGFGGRNCGGSANARCASDGLCHCCVQLCSGSSCVCQSCSGACASPPQTECASDGTCIFSVGGTTSE